jgi:hypothetical protein
MDRAVLIGRGRSLEMAAALGLGGRTSAPASSDRHEQVPLSAIEPLDVVMKRHIEAALAATGGRVEGPDGAARLLRINPHTLRARMRS